MATLDDGRSEQLKVLNRRLDPLRPYLDRADVTELVINRAKELWVESRKGWEHHQIELLDFAYLYQLAKNIASWSAQNIDEKTPLLSAALPTGERVQIVIPPAIEQGLISFTIRKPSVFTLELDEMAGSGSFSLTRGTAVAGTGADKIKSTLFDLYSKGEWKGFLRLAVQAKLNILISGATGSGKTTLSKALIREIPLNERIITIEDTPELVVPHTNQVKLYYSMGGQGQSVVTAKHLLESSLRMRPDRVLLQELRDGTAFYYLRNINSGHPGSITTVHANSPELAFEQLTLLVKESEGGRDLERSDIRALLAQLVDVVVQCKRVDGDYRITEIFYGRST